LQLFAHNSQEVTMKCTPLIQCSAAALGLIAMLVGSSAEAQHLSLAPSVGVYIPTMDLVRATRGQVSTKQQVSVTVGGRLGVDISPRVGLSVTGDYAPSKLRFDLQGDQSSEDANVLTGSARLNVYVIPATSPVSLLLSGGVGVIRRSGDAYADFVDKTDVGPTGGASLRIRLGRVVGFQINAEDYIYKPGLIQSQTTERRTQHDIHLSAGIQLPFLGLGAGA
jgi:Outer membrane protein beta-barrel domain